MRNYAEEFATWYLRLNGFFPISDFVLHRNLPENKYPSDCDVLAVRPPHVHESIGGKWDDWDRYLKHLFEEQQTLGAICDVKAGAYKSGDLFKNSNVERSLKRLGFTSSESEIRTITQYLKENKEVAINSNYKVVKILINNNEMHDHKYYYHLNIQYIREFIKQRMRAYPVKQEDWTFFQSSIIQELIWEVHYGQKSAT